MPTLHRHALESLLAFLDLRDLAAAPSVCRDWRAAVGSMRGAAAVTFALPPPDVHADSSLLRHVAAVGSASRCLPVDGSALLALAARSLPRLRSLCCAIGLLSAPDQAALIFPATLRHLHVEMTGRCRAAHLNAALVSVGRLRQLESLNFFPTHNHADLSFSPLADLPHLRRLELHWRSAGRCSCCHSGEGLKPAQIDQLRRLPALETLRLPFFERSTLARLVAAPHQLRLRDLSMPDPFDDGCGELLPLLPTLTVLQLDRPRLSGLAFLLSLPDLALLDLDLSRSNVSAESVVTNIQSCADLTQLDLAAATVDDEQLGRMLRPLSQLRDLSLRFLDGITSLDAIDTAQLRHSLRRLRLSYCQHPSLSPAEARRLLNFRRLASLILCRSFSEPLDEATIALLQPHSAALPFLDHFEYTPPEVEVKANADAAPLSASLGAAEPAESAASSSAT